jgi:hypothetical protein
MVQLHRLGVSLSGKVRRLASTLTRKTPFSHLRGRWICSRLKTPRCWPPAAACARCFPRLLETPPAPGDRPFGSLNDILVATAALERVAAALSWFAGVRPAPPMIYPRKGCPPLGITEPGQLDAGLLARTWLAHQLLSSEPSLTPLDAPQVSRPARPDRRPGCRRGSPCSATQPSAVRRR